MVQRIAMVLVLCLIAAAAQAREGLLPYDTRWLYPHYLTFRPGSGLVAEVNPPRFSWPYAVDIIDERQLQLREFRFQVSRTPDFRRPAIDVRTRLNFFNTLGPFEPGTWHWRVGYGGAKWSSVRSFIIDRTSLPWDRRAIAQAHQRLSEMPHPRLGPPGGDWAAWRRQLEQDPQTAAWLATMITRADAAMRREWWQAIPASDRKDKTELGSKAFARMAEGAALACFLYRLTGEERFARGIDLALAVAGYPKGGISSPEYHG